MRRCARYSPRRGTLKARSSGVLFSARTGSSAGVEKKRMAPEPVAPEPVVVPYTELAADLLHAVVESFVLREGTDYGEREISLQDKVAGVMNQLRRGEAKIVFDPESESVSIVVS
jgi:uncharacterized protein YheU (UPF0270 family)